MLLAQINTDPFECVQLAFSLLGAMCEISMCIYIPVYSLLLFVFTYFIVICENSGHLAWVRHSSHKISAAHSCQCVRYFHVSKQCYGCQCLGFLTRAQMSMHLIKRWGCPDTARESALKVDSGRKVPCHTRDSNPRQYRTLVFQLDALPTELFPPPSHLVAIKTQNQSLSLILHRMKVEKHASY